MHIKTHTHTHIYAKPRQKWNRPFSHSIAGSPCNDFTVHNMNSTRSSKANRGQGFTGADSHIYTQTYVGSSSVLVDDANRRIALNLVCNYDTFFIPLSNVSEMTRRVECGWPSASAALQDCQKLCMALPILEVSNFIKGLFFSY